MMTRGIFLTLLSITVPALFADTPAPPSPYVTTASFRSVYFKMMPRPSTDWSRHDGFGIAYRLRPDGTDEELWRTEGWYSFEVFLSSFGQHLVAMGPWSEGKEPEAKDLAVSFYGNGKLLKQYSTADLVKNKSKVLRSESHYMWLDRDVKQRTGRRSDPDSGPRLAWNDTFILKTCDGILYEFDIKTGEIKKADQAKRP